MSSSHPLPQSKYDENGRPIKKGFSSFFDNIFSNKTTRSSYHHNSRPTNRNTSSQIEKEDFQTGSFDSTSNDIDLNSKFSKLMVISVISFFIFPPLGIILFYYAFNKKRKEELKKFD